MAEELSSSFTLSQQTHGFASRIGSLLATPINAIKRRLVLSSQDRISEQQVKKSDSVESFGELFTSTQLNNTTVTWDRNISDSVLGALPSQPRQQPDLME